MLRHAQGVVVCLALVTSFGDFLNSSEGDRKMVAIVPATSNYRRARMHSSETRKKTRTKSILDRTIAFFFKIKRGIQGKLLQNRMQIKYRQRRVCKQWRAVRTLPDAFLNALVQRVLRGLYLLFVRRLLAPKVYSHTSENSLPMEQFAAL